MVFALGVFAAACATAPVQPPAPISTGDPRPEPIQQPRPTQPVERPVPTPATPVEQGRDTSKFVTPRHMAGRDVKRIAVLLPFSHPSAGVKAQASDLLAAMEMALFDQGANDVVLLPYDTAGDARTAARVAEQALEEGADIFVGPLFAESVRASANVARRDQIPLLAFSNDRGAAGGGAFLISFPPEEEVARIVDWAVLRGISRFAFMGPSSAYSRRVETALRFEAARRGAIVVGAEFYSPQNEAPVDEAQRLASRIDSATEDGTQKVGVMIAERGTRLLGVAPLLPYYEVDLRQIQYLGTAQWDDPTIWREPVLSGAAFSAADPEDTSLFTNSFDAIYGKDPASLASLGYDAVALSISFLRDGQVERNEIADFDGFRGVNGLFRFRSDGTVERGLAVMEITPSGPRVIENAPTTFNPGGS